jgi:Ca2+-binding RTX toxin-like protein
MRLSGLVRGSLATALSTVLFITPGSAALVAATEHDDPDAIALRDGLASFVESLTGVGLHDPLTDTVPLTPTDLASFLGLDAALALLAADVTSTAGVTFEEIEAALAAGFQLPGGLGSLTGRLDRDTTPYTLELNLSLDRTDDVPIAIGTDLLALSGEGPTLTAGLDVAATLEFDPAALDSPEPHNALRVRTGGTDAATLSFTGDLLANWDSGDPLAANVGILAVNVTGTAAASVEVGARFNTDTGDQVVPRGTWESTGGLDLFTIDQVNASAEADLEVSSDLPGVDGVTGDVTLDWSLADGPADWTEAVEINLGSLGDFNNILIEEVFVAIAQLATTLRAAQVSGAADTQLPFVQESLQAVGFHQALLDWFDDLGLADIPDEGPVVLLDSLDRAALAELGLLDVESVLDNLADFLDFEPNLAYTPATKQLSFDLEYIHEPDPIPLTLAFGDELATFGVRSLETAGSASATAAPVADVNLGMSLSLEFDPERLAEEPDPDTLVSVAERMAVRTADSGISLDFPVTADIDLQGSIGYLGVRVTSAPDAVLLTAKDGADHMVEVSFTGSGLLTLDQLINNLTSSTPSVTSQIAIQIPDTELTVAVHPAITGGSSGTVVLSWPDVTDPSGLDLDLSGLGELADFDFDPDNPLALLEAILQALDVVVDELDGRLRTEGAPNIPLAGANLSQLQSELDTIRTQIHDLATDPAATVQGLSDQLNAMLVNALGLTQNPAVSLEIDTSTGTPALIFRVDVSASRTIDVPLQLDLGSAGSLVGAQSGGQLSTGYLAELGIHAGVQLPSTVGGVPELFLLRSSGARVEFSIDDDVDGIEVNAGPLKLSVGTGDDPASVALDAVAALAAPGTGRQPLADIGGWVADLDLTISGNAQATLPLYLGSTDLGDVEFTAPDLADPAGWNVVVPPDLLTTLASQILSFETLIEGLRYVADLVERSMASSSHGFKVPLVGDALDGGADVAEKIDEFLTEIEDEISSLGGDAQTVRNGITTAINDALSSLDGIDGAVASVELTCDAAPCADATAAHLIDEVEIQLSIGQDASYDLPGFDLGMPGFRLGVVGDTSLTSEVGWSVDLTFGINRVDGFYLRTNAPGPELSADTTVTLPQQLDGHLALLLLNLTKQQADHEELSLSVAGQLTSPSGIISLHRLISGGDSANIDLSLDVDADLQYQLHTVPSIPGVVDLPVDGALPTLTADLAVAWSFNGSTAAGVNVGTPAISLDNVGLDAGSILTGFMRPILTEIRRFTSPFQPAFDVVSAPIPVLSDIYELLGEGPLTMLTLFEAASGADLTMVRRIIGLLQLADAFGVASAAGSIPLGDFTVDGALALDRQLPPHQAGDLITENSPLSSVFAHSSMSGTTEAVERATAGGGGFTFEAFENPTQLVHMLVGRDVSLVEWRSGNLHAGLGHSIDLPPLFVGPVPVVISIFLSASIGGQFGVGYDTWGIRRAVQERLEGGGSSAGDTISLLFQGVYLTDWDQNDVDVPEIVLSAKFGVSGRAELGVAAAGIEGGLQADLFMDLRDDSGTGKVRIDQILANKGFFAPICLFDATGELSLFIDAFLRVGIGFLSKKFTFNLVRLTLLRLEDILSAACAEVKPNLATKVSGDNGAVLVLNAGPRQGQRGVAKDEPEEVFTVRPLNAAQTSFSVAAFGEYEEYHGITGVTFMGRKIKIVGDGGSGPDSLTMADGSSTGIDDEQPIDSGQNDISNTAIPFDSSVLLCGGAADDVITGGRENDLLVGDGSCTVAVDDGDVALSQSTDEASGDGGDTVYGTGGSDEMFGTGGPDELHGSADGSDLMVGGSGDDTLRVPPENTAGSVLIGGFRTTVIGISNPGFDQVFGGGGPDILIGDNGDADEDQVFVGALYSGDGSGDPGSNVLDGGAGNDRVFGGPGVDEGYGGAGDDYLDGGPGNDALVGGVPDTAAGPQSTVNPGSNVIVGGPGNDHLAAHNAEVQLNEAGVANGIKPAGSSTQPALLLGGSLYGATSPGSDTAWGGGAGDLVIGDNASPSDEDLRPTPASFFGAVIRVAYPDALAAAAFAELRGRDADGIPAGVELLQNAGGNDRLYAGPANDSVFGGPGHDILVGGWPTSGTPTGADLLVGNVGNDVLIGGNGTSADHAGSNAPVVSVLSAPTPPAPTVNRLIGGSWDDLEDPGNDWLYAGRFGDVLIGDNGEIAAASLTADVYLTHGGDDHISGSLGDDRGFGGPGEDVVRGGPARDILEGGPGNDEVYGDSGEDMLIGGTSRPGIPSGDDDVFGGFGVDALAGDNARIVQVTADGLHGTKYAVELFDLPMAGGSAPAGTAGADLLSGGSSTDLLYGENGADVVLGDEGNDFLQGGPDDDELYGGTGSDSLAGGNGKHADFQDSWPLLPSDDDVHRVPVPDPGVAFGFADLDGHADSDDLVVGGAGPDGAAGDNAVVEQTGFGQFDVRLLDVEYAGELPPHTGTAGTDVLIGGSIGDAANPGDDLGFGQGKADLLIGDNAAELADARRYAPLLHSSDGDDHLEGNAGDDTLFGNGGPDRLLGGSSDLGVADAATHGVVAGNDVVSGGPGDDYALGDNGRIEHPAPWWSTGVGGASVTLFDEKIDGSGLPHPSTAGNDLLLGGSLRGDGTGLLGDQTEADTPGHDLLHSQARNDLLFGDDVTVDVTDWTAGWHAIRPDTGLPIAQWQISTLDWVVEGDQAADGGDDLVLGGPDDDIAFGGPAQDDMLGGSWQAGRHDGRDLVDGGPSHDVVAGDNATILREFEDGMFTCQTYRHRHGDVAAWQTATSGGFEFDCPVGTPDADPGNGVYTRLLRAAQMLDQAPGVTSGSDLVWGNYGDDDITGQFDDTADFTGGTWPGLPAWRLVEWCRLDAHLAALIAAGAIDVADLSEGDTMADYLAFYGFDIADVAFGGDAVCGAAGEDAVLGDQGVVADIVEDGAREAVIAPQQPFMQALNFAEGTLTRQVELFQRTTGGDDVVLGGGDGDWLHSGAGNDLVNGNFGDDRIFGDDNDDALWGGGGNDHSYGGNHADDLDIRPRLSKPASGSGGPNQPPEHPGDPAERFLVAVEGDGYDGIDHLYGGWHRDVMQANEGDNGPVAGDRAIDWGGVYNLWYNCPATYGAWIDIRSPYPGLEQYLIDQAAGDGALDPGTPGSSGFDELALVYQQDIKDNTNPPHPETPGHFTCGAADGT